MVTHGPIDYPDGLRAPYRWAGCWLTTGADNWEAQPMYLLLGFEIVDTSACYTRQLGRRPASAERS